MLDRLYKILNNDKFMHFVYGIAICALMQPFGTAFALMVVLLVAIVKERIDAKGYGAFEYKDMFFTVSGGAYLVIWQGVISYVQSILA